MSLIEKSARGALLGAGIGAGIGATMHLLKKKNASKTKAAGPDFKYIDANGEMRFHADEILQFQVHHKEIAPLLHSVRDSLDRLLALEMLSEIATAESVKASWPVTAQHFNQEVLDGLVLVRSKITNQQHLVTFDMHVEEIKQQMNNSLYNIDMNVQELLNR
jgi:hypothetical protein